VIESLNKQRLARNCEPLFILFRIHLFILVDFYLLPDDEVFELLLFDVEFEVPDFELLEFDERLGVVVVFVELPDERLGVVVVFVELPDERLGVVVVFVELPDERLGVVVVFVELPDERLGVVVVFVELPDERLGVVVVFVELPDERLGVVVADVPEDGFLVPVLVDGLVVTVELLEGVEFVTLFPDCLVVVPLELLDGVVDELLVSEGRVELLELLDVEVVGRA
jgi:hypothetical protein